MEYKNIVRLIKKNCQNVVKTENEDEIRIIIKKEGKSSEDVTEKRKPMPGSGFVINEIHFEQVQKEEIQTPPHPQENLNCKQNYYRRH